MIQAVRMLIRCALNAFTLCLFDHMWVQSAIGKIAQPKTQREPLLLLMLYSGSRFESFRLQIGDVLVGGYDWD